MKGPHSERLGCLVAQTETVEGFGDDGGNGGDEGIENFVGEESR